MANEVNYFKVSDLPVVDAVPEGATVLAYSDGQLMRIDGSKVGGGKIEIIEFVPNAETQTVTCSHTYEEFQEVVTGKGMYMIRCDFSMDGTTTNYMSQLCVVQNEDNFATTFMLNGQLVDITYFSDGTIDQG